MYRRVEKPEFEYTSSTYAIAQQHLAMLKNTNVSGPASASH